jgi:hypothetical protein
MNSGPIQAIGRTQATQNLAGELLYKDQDAIPSRETANIRDRANGHAAQIYELAEHVRQFADSLYGSAPMPASAPATQSTGLTRDPPMMESIRTALTGVDEAIAMLQRELSRLDNL